MEFTVNCPNDGPVPVSIEDVETVVLQERECAEVVFACPHCGEAITVRVLIPSFLMAAIEAITEGGDARAPIAGLVALITEESVIVETPETEDEPAADAYCEYFRRQLSHIDCVEDMLGEIDA